MATMVLKRIFYRMVIICIVINLIACDGSEYISGTILTYWSSNNPEEIEFADYVVKKWNTLNPDQQIFTQPVPEGRSSEEVILAAVVGETTPDIYSNMWQGDVEFFAQAGTLIPLDTLEGFLETLYQRCDSSVIDEITSSDGHIYQIPWKINPIMMICNINMFKEIGFKTAPKTYTEYLQAGAKMHKDLDGDGYVDLWVGYSSILVDWWQRFFDFYSLYLAASNGGKLIDKGKVVFNNQSAIAVFRFLQEVYKKNYFTRELLSARQDVFLEGFIATRFVGPWEIIHAEKFRKEGFDYYFREIPVPDSHSGPVYTYGDPKNMVLFNTCKNPQKAWEFLRFVISAENDFKLLEVTTQLPRRKKIITIKRFSDYFDANPKLKPFAIQADYVRGTDICPQLKEVFDIISQEYEACVIYGTKTPEKAIEEAAEAAQVILK
jgi:multiple sugar transport system substrate-binding protein